MVVASTFFQFQYHQILKFIYPSSYTIKKFVLCSIFLVELTFCFKFISLNLLIPLIMQQQSASLMLPDICMRL